MSAVVVSAVLASPLSTAQSLVQHATTHKPAGPEVKATQLPIRRVLLYKNGVGFFEHVGTVNGNQRVTIDFTSSQLNDVLQSLTAIDLNGGHIAGAEYNSATPLDQQLKVLPLGLGADATTDEFYSAIRGARIQVRSGTQSAIGRLLNVELRDTRDAHNGSDAPLTFKLRQLTLISDTGAMQTIDLTYRTEVQLLDTGLHQDVNRYLQLLASNRTQELRHLTLETDGSGTREIHVSYISEVPVWKATYRILFGGGSKNSSGTETATLQGWAVVDNTVGTDWENVQLSLIAGTPQSFIQQISQPFYARRPEIGLPQEAQLSPQTHESGEGAVQGAAGVAGARKAQGMGGGIVSGPLEGGMASGIGSGVAHGSPQRIANNLQMAQGNAAPAMLKYEDSAAASITPNTNTSAFDDYFEYALTAPITIRKNESALVPILQSKVEAERVTLWSPSQSTALRALWLKNTSDLTLDRGSFSIVEDGKFGGQGLLEPIHPHEKRLVSYAADQAVRVTTDRDRSTRRLQRVAVSKGILTEQTLEIAEREYLVHNAASEARAVIVEQPMRQGWQLDSEVKPVETTATAYRFRLITAPGETVHLHLAERHTISQTYQLANMGEEQLDLLLRTNGDDSHFRQQLTPIFEAKRRLADLDAQLATRESAINEIAKDQQRLRDNLGALKGSSEERALVRRYSGELNQQEDKINLLHKEQENLREQRNLAEKDLSDKIASLQLDDKIG